MPHLTGWSTRESFLHQSSAMPRRISMRSRRGAFLRRGRQDRQSFAKRIGMLAEPSRSTCSPSGRRGRACWREPAKSPGQHPRSGSPTWPEHAPAGLARQHSGACEYLVRVANAARSSHRRGDLGEGKAVGGLGSGAVHACRRADVAWPRTRLGNQPTARSPADHHVFAACTRAQVTALSDMGGCRPASAVSGPGLDP